MTKTFQPGLFSRLVMAAKLVTRGGMAEVVEHFRRAGGARLNGGPADPHSQIVAVFRCVQFLAEAVAFMPFCVSTQDDRIIESGPIADLLDKPNPMMSIEEFWQQTIGWMLLSERGSAYWVFTRRIGGRPVEIVPVGDAQIRPITDGPRQGVGDVIAWEYRAAGTLWQQAVRLELDEVWQVKVPGFDADRPWHGTPIMGVIRRAINQVYKSDIANEASLDNGVEPGGVLILDGTPGTDQENEIKAAMDDRRGSANRRRHLVLKGNIRWEQIAASFTDMEFEKLKRFSRADICAGFGLDPSAVGFPPEGGRFEYAQAAESKAWIGRVLPLSKTLAGNFDRGVLSHYEQDQSLGMGRSIDDATHPRRAQRAFAQRADRRQSRRLNAWFDASVVEAVKELYKSRVDTASKMVTSLKATPEEAGDLMDLGLAGNDAQKLIWQSTSEMPFDPIQPGEDDPAGPLESPPGDDSDGIEEEADRPTDDPDDKKNAVEREVTEQQLAQIHAAWRRSWSPIERAMQRRVSRHFNNLRGIVLNNLDKAPLARGSGHPTPEPLTFRWTDEDGRAVARTYRLTPVHRDLIGEILFDLVEANGKLRVLVSPLIRQGFALGGEQAVTEHALASGQDAADADPFNLQDPGVAQAMRRREIKLTDINKTVRNRLRAQIAQALEANEPVGKVAERIRKEFNFASARSKTIARTEVGRSVEEARHEGRRQAGTPLKSWLWSRKETGRPWHMETERATLAEPVPNDQVFTVAQTGNTCPHPRATNDPQDDINCGCTTIARFPGDSVKAVVARYLTHRFMTPERLARRNASETTRGAA